MTSKAATSPACDHRSPDCPGGEANIAPYVPAGYMMWDGELISISELEKNGKIIQSKGPDLLGGGVTGVVERLASGDAIKSTWTGHPTDCRQQITIEAQIYERLGAHPRLVQPKHWDPVDYTLTLEYMPNGNLKEYVKNHGQDISTSQRQTWAMQAAEGVELLHSHGVIQADVGPHNFLLDADLGLRISDFGGSSLDGSLATVAPGVRYALPSLAQAWKEPPTIKEDLFALGSTIYFIATGREPFDELTDYDEVEKLYKAGVFPELGGVPFAEAIALCWRQEAESAQMVMEIIRRSLE